MFPQENRTQCIDLFFLPLVLLEHRQRKSEASSNPHWNSRHQANVCEITRPSQSSPESYAVPVVDEWFDQVQQWQRQTSMLHRSILLIHCIGIQIKPTSSLSFSKLDFFIVI